jgi:hypothetical protein
MVKNDILIRNEYPEIDDKTFWANKIKFLNHMLGVYGNSLYMSDVFKHLNENAYDNIQKRIEEIKYGMDIM